MEHMLAYHEDASSTSTYIVPRPKIIVRMIPFAKLSMTPMTMA